MKKSYLFMSGMLAIAIASCTVEDEPSLLKDESEAIAFRPAMSMSRAAEVTNANLSSIYVTALDSTTTPYFSEINYIKGSDGFFNSNPLKYWPTDNRQLTFYAYAPNMADEGAEIQIDSEAKTISFVVADEIADQVDFITATATGNRKQNEKTGVELNFEHQLAQISLQAKSGNENYTFEVAGGRIGRPYSTATFDFTTSEWTMDPFNDTQVISTTCTPVTLQNDPVSIMGEDGNAMVLPQKFPEWMGVKDPDNVVRGKYLGALVRITDKDGNVVFPTTDDKHVTTIDGKNYQWVATPLGGEWEHGKLYVYTLDFTNGGGYTDPDDPTHPGIPVLPGAIKFSVNVSDWTNADIPVSMETE